MGRWNYAKHNFFVRPNEPTVIHDLNPHPVVKKYPLIQLCGVRVDPRECFGLTSSVLNSSRVTIYVSVGSVRTPQNWMRVNET